MRHKHRAFTLVELLVVIAIIALLVSILLPALKNARRVAKLNQSLGNLRQIAIASDSYRTENKGIPAIAPIQQGRVPATWSFGGKNCQGTPWINGFYDFPANTRPLNSYVQPDVNFERGNPTTANRASIELPVFRSPGDTASYQRGAFPTASPQISCYDDVGSSYHYNGRWYALVPTTSAANWANYNMRLGKAFGKMMDLPVVNTARFVMFHDQAADVVSNDPSMRNWITEFGDRNKSVMAFLDGHIDYLAIVPGAHEGPGYQFRFPQMANILQGVRP